MEPATITNRPSYVDMAKKAANGQPTWRAELAKISVFLLVNSSFYEVAKAIRAVEWNDKVDAIIPSGKGKWRLTFKDKSLCDRFFSTFWETGIQVANQKATIAKNKALHVLHVEAENPLATKMDIVEILKAMGTVKRMEKVMNNGFWTGIWMVWSDIQLKQRSATIRGPDYRVKIVDRAWRSDEEERQPQGTEQEKQTRKSGIRELDVPRRERSERQDSREQPMRQDDGSRTREDDQPDVLGKECRMADTGEHNGAQVASSLQDHSIEDDVRTQPDHQEIAGNQNDYAITEEKETLREERTTGKWVQPPITSVFKRSQDKPRDRDKRNKRAPPPPVSVIVREIPEMGILSDDQDQPSCRSVEPPQESDGDSNEESNRFQTARGKDEQEHEKQHPPKKSRKAIRWSEEDQEMQDAVSFDYRINNP